LPQRKLVGQNHRLKSLTNRENFTIPLICGMTPVPHLPVSGSTCRVAGLFALMPAEISS
jgi:hypothetical protein